MIQLRDYQREAVNRTIEWIKRNIAPCLVEMSVGAGKSLYVAEVARLIHEMSGKRVLCIAPRSELVIQNHSRYLALGLQASIYSASAGQKSLRYPVVFATPGTFAKVAERLGHEFAAVIVDEGEGITNTIRKIIEDMRKGSPNLRVIGTTGTPFVTGQGYVYAHDEEGRAMPETKARDPYYVRLLYRVTTRYLLDRGFLTQPIVGDTGVESYDTLELMPNRAGKFNPADIDRVFVGHGRKTATIVADAMRRMSGRKAIVFFAATARHAEEIMASLHPDYAAVVTGETKNRDVILKKFAAGKLRVLVTINILTVGWDCPTVDGLVLMRATESARLLTQIVGRCLRLHPDKKDSLILDYAANFERHSKEAGDIFDLDIRASYKGEGKAEVECHCPSCNGVNVFAARPNPSELPINDMGYFCDLDGNEILDSVTGKPLPGHLGRRCRNLLPVKGGEYVQCDYFWSCKICPVCECDNDIAARYCRECKEELIDPAQKLTEIHQKAKKDPTKPQCDEVLNMEVVETLSRSGNPIARVTFTTPYRVFTVYFQREATNQWQHEQYRRFLEVGTPRTVTAVKDGDFWKIKAYNQPTDDEVLQERMKQYEATKLAA